MENASSTGFQISANYKPLPEWNIYANGAWNKPFGLNDLKGETFFTPEIKTNFGASWHSKFLKGFMVSVDGQFVGKTNEDALKNTPFTKDNQQSYFILNSKIAYQLPLGVEFFILGNNLLDQNFVAYYESDPILNAAGERFGFELMGGISYKYTRYK